METLVPAVVAVPSAWAEAQLAVAAVKAWGYLGNLLSGMPCSGS